MKIIEDFNMLEDGEPHEEKRSWKERLFSLPWNPLKSTKTVVPKVPSRQVLILGDTVIVHPNMACILRNSNFRAGLDTNPTINFRSIS